jgi:peptide/nickel transport system substrate-binding protein
VAVEVQVLTRGELEADWPDGPVFGRRFDLALFGWRVGSTPPCELFTSAQVAADDNPGGANNTGYASAAFDAACRAALWPLDLEASAEHHRQAQRLFASDVPALPLYFQPRYAVTGPGLQGYTLDGSSASELWNIELWSAH